MPGRGTRTAEDQLRGDLGLVGATGGIRVHLIKLDIQPDELVLPWDDHQAAVFGRVDRTSHPDVGCAMSVLSLDTLASLMRVWSVPTHGSS